MRIPKLLLLILAVACLNACAATPAVVEHDPGHDLGVQWVKHAAEYEAVSKQVYAQATRDLRRFVDDKSWSAMPGFAGHSDLPPAVILDVDETVVSNVDFQLTFERPFAAQKLEEWSDNYTSRPINGVVDFIAAARAANVTVFFLTNRPCEARKGDVDPCPMKRVTLEDIRELGIAVDAEHLLLSLEKPGWNREKLSRREYIASTHRVIMLFGDDFGDFVPCARKKIVAPCEVAATRASRLAALDRYAGYWGEGWYILPNPMHGSWTSAE